MNNNEYLTKKDLKELLEIATKNSEEYVVMGCGDWSKKQIIKENIIQNLIKILGNEDE